MKKVFDNINNNGYNLSLKYIIKKEKIDEENNRFFNGDIFIGKL